MSGPSNPSGASARAANRGSTRTLSRRAIVVGAAAALLTPLSAVAASGSDSDEGAAWTPPGRGQGAEDRYVHHQLETMTLEEKVGQLFVTYVYGSNADRKSVV